MNHAKHLSSREISQLLVEGRSSRLADHVENCWNCQAKLEEARAPLAAFRSAVIGWSEEQGAGRNAAADRGRSDLRAGARFGSWFPAMSLSLGMAILLAIFTQAGGWKMFTPHHSAAETHVSDAALMDQVDEEVSEAVPDSMSPLTDLVGWDGEGHAAARSKSSQGDGKVSGVHPKKEMLD